MEKNGVLYGRGVGEVTTKSGEQEGANELERGYGGSERIPASGEAGVLPGAAESGDEGGAITPGHSGQRGSGVPLRHVASAGSGL